MTQHIDIPSGQDRPADDLLVTEWLLTNGRGSFACGSAVGANTRKYHGLLLSAVRPPGERACLLANLVEEIDIDGQVFPLSCFEFENTFHPRGDRLLTAFDCDKSAGTVAWTYQLGRFALVKRLALARKLDAIAVRYELSAPAGGPAPRARLRVGPLLAYRHYHDNRTAAAGPAVHALWDGQLLRVADVNNVLPGMRLQLTSGEQVGGGNSPANPDFLQTGQWWHRFHYRIEADRQENPWEDLFCPGQFECELGADGSAELLAAVEPFELLSFQPATESQSEHFSRLARSAAKASPLFASSSPGAELLIAADDFIARTPDGQTSILAGFPWFADWGRDAFIALPGLLLATGRYDEAFGVLRRFARAIRGGLVPNRFSDATGMSPFPSSFAATTEVHAGAKHKRGEGHIYQPADESACEGCDYNSVDAGLWLIHAAFAWAKATGQWAKFDRELLEPARAILHGYHSGTRYNIHVDDDGLLISGTRDVQVTWMDAMVVPGEPITPRAGKCVETNALFGHGLRLLADRLEKIGDAEAGTFRLRYEQWAENFPAAFASPRGGLCDLIELDGRPNVLIRPNQLLAVSLGDCPLPAEVQCEVVDIAISKLLTPFGLRTLAPGEPGYCGNYCGGRWQRDSSYHQGTAWAWLIGPFIEAYLRVNDFSASAAQQAREWLQPLLAHMGGQACLGQVSEIFDADPPHTPRGAFAQAWSVAELIRALALTS